MHDLTRGFHSREFDMTAYHKSIFKNHHFRFYTDYILISELFQYYFRQNDRKANLFYMTSAN